MKRIRFSLRTLILIVFGLALLMYPFEWNVYAAWHVRVRRHDGQPAKLGILTLYEDSQDPRLLDNGEYYETLASNNCTSEKPEGEHVLTPGTKRMNIVQRILFKPFRTLVFIRYDDTVIPIDIDDKRFVREVDGELYLDLTLMQ